MMTPKDEMLTKEDVCKYLQISHGTLQKLMSRTDRPIPYIKFERKVLFRLSAIDKWMESFKGGQGER